MNGGEVDESHRHFYYKYVKCYKFGSVCVVNFNVNCGGGAARVELLDADGNVVESVVGRNNITKYGVEYASSQLFGRHDNTSLLSYYDRNFVFNGDGDSNYSTLSLSVNDIDGVSLARVNTGSSLQGGGEVDDIIVGGGGVFQYGFKTATYPFGSVVGSIHSISIYATSSDQSPIAEVALPQSINVLGTNQLRVTYYRFQDCTEFIDVNKEVILNEVVFDGGVVKWSPYINFRNMRIVPKWAMGIGNLSIDCGIYSGDTSIENVSISSSNWDFTSSWSGDIFTRSLEVFIRIPPSFNDYENASFDVLNLTPRNDSDGTPIEIIFDEPITKTGSDVFEMDFTLSVSFTQTDDIPQEDIDFILSQI